MTECVVGLVFISDKSDSVIEKNICMKGIFYVSHVTEKMSELKTGLRVTISRLILIKHVCM